MFFHKKQIKNNAIDEQLRIFEEVYEYSKKLLVRKEEIIALLKEKNFLDEKVLKNLESATTLQACEDIHAYLQQVDFSRVNTCYTRSAPSLSQQKPQQIVATASYRFGDNQTAWADVLNQLNDQGRQGYALITPSVALKNPEGSNSIYKNLYVKNNASQDTYT